MPRCSWVTEEAAPARAISTCRAGAGRLDAFGDCTLGAPARGASAATGSRSRIIGKSSAARGRVTFPPFSCNSDVITRPRRSARSGPGHCFRRRRPAGSPVSISFFRKGRGRAEPRAGPHPSALRQAKPARSQVSARVRLPAQRFVPDSPLEGDGFEPSVPGEKPWVSPGPGLSRSKPQRPRLPRRQRRPAPQHPHRGLAAPSAPSGLLRRA